MARSVAQERGPGIIPNQNGSLICIILISWNCSQAQSQKCKRTLNLSDSWNKSSWGIKPMEETRQVYWYKQLTQCHVILRLWNPMEETEQVYYLDNGLSFNLSHSNSMIIVLCNEQRKVYQLYGNISQNSEQIYLIVLIFY